MLVAPPNKAALQCIDCHQWMDLNHSALDSCAYCEHISYQQNSTFGYQIALLYAEQEKLDIQNALSTVWFHATERNNWQSYVQSNETLVHLGSEMAALDRMSDLRSWSYDPQQITLFSVRLRPSATIDPQIYLDEDANELTQDMAYDVVRYVNAWESIGSVSLVAKSSCFEIVESELIQVSD